MSHSVSRDMSWLEGCPAGGQAGGRSRVPGEPEARGTAAWMRLACVLAATALVFATAPARAQEEAEPAKDAEVSEAGAEEAAPAADETEPAAYAEFLGTETLPFDFVWFTPIADPEDPCAKFAEQLQRARARHEKNTKDPE